MDTTYYQKTNVKDVKPGHMIRVLSGMMLDVPIDAKVSDVRVLEDGWRSLILDQRDDPRIPSVVSYAPTSSVWTVK